MATGNLPVGPRPRTISSIDDHHVVVFARGEEQDGRTVDWLVSLYLANCLFSSSSSCLLLSISFLTEEHASEDAMARDIVNDGDPRMADQVGPHEV